MASAYLNIRNNNGLSDEEIMNSTPAIAAQSYSPKLSLRYQLVQTMDLINILRKEDFLPVMVGQTFPRKGSPHSDEHMFHVVRFQKADSGQIIKGVTPEIVVTNSNNGTSAFKIMNGAFRTVCANGVITGDTYDSFAMKHLGDDLKKGVIDVTYHVVEQSNRLATAIKEMTQLPLQKPQRLALASGAMELRWEKEDSPIRPDDLLAVRRSEDAQKTDLWTTFNVIQENLIRGGMIPTVINPKKKARPRVRGINSVKEDIKLNRALWTLTEALRAQL